MSSDLSISEELWRTYVEVRLEITLGSGQKWRLFSPHVGLDVCAELAEYLRSGPGFLITAWNPLSRRVSDRENHAANLRLEGRLVADASVVLSATGSSEDETYKEEGFAVFGIAPLILSNIALAFRQHAVYAFDMASLICVTSDLSIHRSLSGSSRELTSALRWGSGTKEVVKQWSS